MARHSLSFGRMVVRARTTRISTQPGCHPAARCSTRRESSSAPPRKPRALRRLPLMARVRLSSGMTSETAGKLTSTGRDSHLKAQCLTAGLSSSGLATSYHPRSRAAQEVRYYWRIRIGPGSLMARPTTHRASGARLVRSLEFTKSPAAVCRPRSRFHQSCATCCTCRPSGVAFQAYCSMLPAERQCR